MALLSQHIGLNLQSLGDVTLNRAINQAIQQSGLQSDTDYLNRVKTSKAELANFIDTVVVPETHFFRNPESFDYLAQHIRRLKQAKLGHRRLRVLSLPCSSGEEPYSIAMTLLEAGYSNFQVDGVDISSKALVTARQGIYKRYSFRNTASFSPQYYLDTYFVPAAPDKYRINNRVRSHVNFYPGNLSDSTCLPNHGTYDILFCRNLLIYFHASAREQALNNLYRLLVADGLLFIGYAETRQIHPQQFKPLGIPQAFAYRKVSHWPAPPLPQPKSPAKQLPVITTHGPRSLPSPKISPQSSLPHPPSEGLQKIRKLADDGQLGAALERCDAYLQAHPTSAAAYLLLGEIYHAQGSDQRAEIAFNRVLYLQPDCIEALTYSLLLCEQRADHQNAQRLRQRIYRVTKNK